MSNTDLTELRQIASEWHGGQRSPLLAFASTGTMIDGLEAEIRDNLKLLVAGQYSAEEINAETPRLSALLDYVVSMTPECYSDHAEDIRTKGSCDYCGGTK